jgi:hypothetical protein
MRAQNTCTNGRRVNIVANKKIDTTIEYVCDGTNENAIYICHFRVITMLDEGSKIDRNLRSDVMAIDKGGINMSATTRRID